MHVTNQADIPSQLPSRTPQWELIELLFFAYRDFVGDPDEVLARFGFGRAHHRVLYFVYRAPGLKVADLLDILGITKQSLARVLKQLVDEDYIEQREGARDRRQRLLFVTPKGEALVLKLVDLQTRRILHALGQLDDVQREGARQFLRAMVDDKSRNRMTRIAQDGARSSGEHPHSEEPA